MAAGGRKRRDDRYTAGQLDTDLYRIIRALVADAESHARHLEQMGYLELGYDPGPSDRRLRQLHAIASIRSTLDRRIDSIIVSGRRDRPPLTWRELGAALNMTGQAVGQRARARNLPIHPPSADEFTGMVNQARAARGLPPLPPDTRPLPDVEKYDQLLPRTVAPDQETKP